MLRVASASVLVPLALATAYWGGWVFLIFWALAAFVVLWEWTGLVAGRSDVRQLLPGVAALFVAFALAGMDRFVAAGAMVAIGAAIAGILAAEQDRHETSA